MVSTVKNVLIIQDNPLQMHFWDKTVSKREIQKTGQATGDVIGNKIADKTLKVSKTLPQNNSEAVSDEHDKEMPKKDDISQDERPKIIEYLRLI